MMFRKAKHIWIFVLLTVVLVSCEETYPALYKEEKTDIGVPSENKEVGRVPIVLTLGDPQYELLTRGTGAFEDYAVDAEHWRNADFRTFAFLTTNKIMSDQNAVDYSKRDLNAALLFDQRMRIADASLQIQFFDENLKQVTKYYNETRPQWRYNFFTYYADGCQASDYKTTKKTVKVDVEIDGTQDIMHGLAYHTSEQFKDTIKALYGGDEAPSELKPLLDADNDTLRYLYSTMAGHRGIHPVFHANHLLTRIDFKIRGVKSANKNEEDKENYQRIVVRKVAIEKQPYKGTLTVANDDWKDPKKYQQALKREAKEEEKVLTFSNNPTKDFEVVMEKAPVTDTFDWLKDDPIYQESPYTEEDAQFHITTETSQKLGKAVLIPPCDKLAVRMEADFLDIGLNTETGKPELKSEIKRLTIYYDVNYKKNDQEIPFEAGHAYTVVINVYGVQKINGSMVLNGWVGEDGGEYDPDDESHQIDIGLDDEEDNAEFKDRDD